MQSTIVVAATPSRLTQLEHQPTIDTRSDSKDQRAKFGFRYVVAKNSSKSLLATLGCGASTGTTHESDIRDISVRTEVVSDSGFTTELALSHETRTYNMFSQYSFGGFVEMGTQFHIYRNLSAMTTAQLHAYVSGYKISTWFFSFTDWAHFIEPSLSIALRYDLK